MSETDEEFERFMNIVRMRYDRKDWGLDVDPTGMWKFPAKSDQWFLEAMEDIAPEIIDRWMGYLAEKGNLTLDQALFGSGNFAKRRAAAAEKVDREFAFFHWLSLERRAKRHGTERPNLSKLAKNYDAVNYDSVLREYRRFKKRITGLPPIPDK